MKGAIGISNPFVKWVCYFAVRPGVILRTMPVTLHSNMEPPAVLARDGVQCQRVHFDPMKRYVAYAYPAAMDDLRTVVELVRGFEA